MSREFENKVVLVTGAGGGIGSACWKHLHREGADLILLDRDVSGIPAGERIETIALDLTAADLEAKLDSLLGHRTRLDGLVNVAGMQIVRNLVDCSAEDFENTFSVNLRAAFVVSTWAARRMLARKAGAIVAVSSTSGRMPRKGQGLYCGSKAGLTQMMRVLGLELAPSGVRVNTVAPGSTDTPMVRHMAQTMGYGNEVLQGSAENFRLGIPLGRMAEVEDVAEAIAFLLSDRARHVTMHELIVDGGGTLGL